MNQQLKKWEIEHALNALNNDIKEITDRKK